MFATASARLSLMLIIVLAGSLSFKLEKAKIAQKEQHFWITQQMNQHFRPEQQKEQHFWITQQMN